MNVDVFVDTNVLVYAYDRSEPIKQAIAHDVLRNLEASSRGAISTQVLAELFNALTKRISMRMDPVEAAEHVRNQAASWDVLPITADVVLSALDAVTRLRLSYWDAQILAAASTRGVRVLLTEDMNAESTLDGIRIVNPFSAGFSLHELFAGISADANN
jgi:predicted nucleic acid-binding protein